MCVNILIFLTNILNLSILDGPRPPINLAVKTASWNFFTMTWDHAGDLINGYQVVITQNDNFVSKAVLDKKATIYTAEELSPLTPYEFLLSSVGKETNSIPVTYLVNTTARPNIGKHFVKITRFYLWKTSVFWVLYIFVHNAKYISVYSLLIPGSRFFFEDSQRML